MPRHRREVEGGDHQVVRVGGAADEADHAVVAVGAVDPGKAGRVEVELVHRLLGAQHAVQVADPLAQSRMLGEVQQVPVEARVVIPLPPLPELAAHEHQLLAGLRVHPPEQEPQVRELLPVVAGHLVQQRALAVHHLVV